MGHLASLHIARSECQRLNVTGQMQTPSRLFGSSAVVKSYVASDGVAEEARTRGFVPPTFAGFAFVAAVSLAGGDIPRRQSGVKKVKNWAGLGVTRPPRGSHRFKWSGWIIQPIPERQTLRQSAS